MQETQKVQFETGVLKADSLCLHFHLIVNIMGLKELHMAYKLIIRQA